MIDLSQVSEDLLLEEMAKRSTEFVCAYILKNDKEQKVKMACVSNITIELLGMCEILKDHCFTYYKQSLKAYKADITYIE